MDFRQLQYLLTVAEYRNITRAAEALFISQSALSHYIKKTEDELGVALFDRSTSPLSLTFAGQCYMESARRILLENERLTRELRDITRHMTGTLRIGIPRDRASYMLPRLLPPFAARYPGIRVEILSQSGQELREALHKGRVDLVLLPASGMESESGLSAQTIYTEELVLAAPKGALSPDMYRAGTRAIRPQALDSRPFFLMFQEHTLRNFCDSYFKEHHIHPEIRMEFSSNITCYRMAATGMGFTIIPYLTTQLANAGGEISLFSLDQPPVTWEVQMFYRKDFYLGQPERDLIRLATEVFRQEMLDR